ncbi:MAG TPA: VIT1/CCC1 transporter family protein [Xanthobacteraceae bacterium]|jgi:VIT1/CCC1 family predicted Fe2+/Mn2+ transporter|nr:VIT1/CCC1 transporter family protein [Xanthobacteraceae bacterium]
MDEPSLWGRLETSLQASAGEVVFGMEDGTVSIFGLVFGVAATTTDQKAVLIAGASGAVAAAVSMMAGTYLDVETSQDQAKMMALRIDSDLQRNPSVVLEDVTQRLQAVGLARDESATVGQFLKSRPSALRSFAMALAMPTDAAASQSALVRSLWMLIADFLAAAIPILPFGFLPVPQGRVVSGIVTTLLLVALGVGRAKIGGRGIVRTVFETVSIGVAAAIAGVAIGVFVSHIFT